MIFGTGAHARKAYHCWTLAGGTVTAFADENPAATSPVPGVAVVSATHLDALRPSGQLFIAIGRAEVRQRLMDRYAERGWQLPALIHPRASVAPDAALGAGVIVAAGAVVESGTQVGRGAIVAVGVIDDHDCRVAAFCHLREGQVCRPASYWPE